MVWSALLEAFRFVNQDKHARRGGRECVSMNRKGSVGRLVMVFVQLCVSNVASSPECVLMLCLLMKQNIGLNSFADGPFFLFFDEIISFTFLINTLCMLLRNNHSGANPSKAALRPFWVPGAPCMDRSQPLSF